MTRITVFLTILILMATPLLSEAKKKKGPGVQEVNFGEMDIKGTARNPDGAYLVQKRGVKFLPLYEVQKTYDAKIRDSSLLMR